MITYLSEKKVVNKLVSVTCDVCGKTYKADDLEAQEFEHIRHNGGYDSIFGDSFLVTCDICQYCLKEMMGDYLHRGN